MISIVVSRMVVAASVLCACGPRKAELCAPDPCEPLPDALVCECNADIDQRVASAPTDAIDITIVGSCEGMPLSSPCGGCAATGTCADADINCDGSVTQCDLDIGTCILLGHDDCCPTACP